MRDISNNAVPYGDELKGLETQAKIIFPAIHLSMRKLLLLLRKHSAKYIFPAQGLYQ